MDVATMAFLNRFQWATIFGAASRQLPCATKTEATRPCTATDRTCHCADRPIYQDSGTQTIDESILNPNDDHLDETERVLESSPDEAPGETFDEECGGENHSEYIDEQSVREERYVRIHDEVEEDYTAGPLRLVLATDGLKDDCPALLMNLELSGLIQQAIYAERQFVRAERHETDTRIELMRLESAVKREIRAHEYRLDQDQVDDLETAAVASATDEAVSAASVKELENLRLLLADVGQRKQRAAAQVETEAMLLHNCTRALTECLEDAFTAAELVWPEEQAPDIDVEPLDLKQEYQAFCEQLREMEEGSQASSVAALNVTGDTYLRVPPQVLGPEEQAEADLKSAFFDAQERLQNATFYFDKRGMARHEDRQRTDEDEQVFDLRWVQHISELTREVIDAEEGLAIAKTAAREAGLNVTLEYQSSGFAETEGSGDRMSIGDELIVPARMENISGWLSGVDEEVSSETASSADVDDWEARDVEICDSISLVAYGVDRRKIDGWQQDCRRYNEE